MKQGGRRYWHLEMYGGYVFERLRERDMWDLVC